MDKDTLQGIAAHQLAKEHRLVCMWATSCGKSGVALKFIRDNPWMKSLILVPEHDNIKNWREEFKKFGIDDSKTEIMCYASLHKVENTRWDFLVLDEMPHIDTEKRAAFLSSVKADYVLALGAVVDEEEMETLTSLYGYFPVSRISLEKAMEMGIVPAPKVYVLHMHLDAVKKEHYHNGFLLTAQDKYLRIQKKVDDAKSAYEKSPTKGNHSKMLRAGNERKRFLGAQKEDALRRICEKLQEKNRRFLCFCASIEQANRLGGNNAFTSKSPKHIQHLSKFNNHEIDSLYVVGKLIEGQNLADIECGVIGQLSGKERITVQEIGRILRAENPVVYLPVFDDTKDDALLYNITSNIPSTCIKHYKF